MRLKPPSRAASTLTMAMVVLVATTIFAEQLSSPRSADQRTAMMVANLISQYHISRREIGDDVAAMMLDGYLKDLDPRKLYFTKADVDALSAQKRELDDKLKRGDVDFAYTTFDLFLKRLDERTELAQKLIDAEHDFTVEESLIVDADDLEWAANDEEILDRWRKQVKYELLQLKLDDKSDEEARERLHRRYRLNRETLRQTEDYEKLEMFLTALAQSFDPHSSYMSPQKLEDFRISMELQLEGIGAALRWEDGYTIVANIVPGGAADKDGRLKKDDRIIGVDSGDGTMHDVVEKRLKWVVQLIRGKRGTNVRLKVKKADIPAEDGQGEVKKGETVVYDLVRERIELKSAEVKGEIINSGERFPGTNLRVGVINIPSFYHDFRGARRGSENFKSTARDVEKVLTQFERQGGVDFVIVDLRTNGGGALSEAVDVSGLFIDEGPVVVVKDPSGEREPHKDLVPGALCTVPMVVVCNRLSASASEIFAGVIKDYHRGIIIGDQSTHGKGTVQNVINVNSRRGAFGLFKGDDYGALKLTISKFYRVNGDSTQNRGVHSDIVLPSILDHMDLGESFLDNALEFDKIEPAEFEPVAFVTPQIISALQQRSRQRVVADPEFQKTEKEIERYLIRKKRKSISLNLAARRKEMLEDKQDEEKVEELTNEQTDEEGPIFPDDSYNNEVMRIGIDYVGLLNASKTARRPRSSPQNASTRLVR